MSPDRNTGPWNNAPSGPIAQIQFIFEYQYDYYLGRTRSHYMGYSYCVFGIEREGNCVFGAMSVTD